MGTGSVMNTTILNSERMEDPIVEDSGTRLFKILFLEDNDTDVDLMQSELILSNIPFDSKVIYMKHDYLNAVSDFQPDIILADYNLPSFDGMQAFRQLRKKHLYIPFILVTGVLSEQVALECLKEGVDDFILKSSFKRLPMAISNAVKKKEIEREGARMAEELRKSHEELRLFLSKEQMAREEERLIIARDLHDELGQVLTALKIDITMFGKKALSEGKYDQKELTNEYRDILKVVDRITQSVKRISSGLRPEILDELGVIEAIKWLAQEFERRNQIKCQIRLPDELNVNKNFPITLFRIVQETLTNIARHAQATRVKIELKLENNILFLEISDNGIGIKQEEIDSSSSLGIIGIRERTSSLNGNFKITGRKDLGTVVSVTIPIE